MTVFTIIKNNLLKPHKTGKTYTGASRYAINNNLPAIFTIYYLDQVKLTAQSGDCNQIFS